MIQHDGAPVASASASPRVCVTICIASAGRSSLLATLKSVAALKCSERIVFDVLVVDDSKDGRAAALICEEGPWSVPIKCVHCGAGNVAMARNVCLDHAMGDWLCFIDDDERAPPDWLDRLMALAQDVDADAVFGPVKAVYPPEAPQWLRAADPYSRKYGRRGQRLSHGPTCNTLVKRKLIIETGLRFDPAFGQTGGEDNEFFAQLAEHYGVLVASDDAVVLEDIPIERLQFSFMRHRFMRGGQCHARLVLKRAGLPRRVTFYGISVVKAATLLSISALLFPFRRDLAFQAWKKGWLNFGKARHAFNVAIPQFR